MNRVTRNDPRDAWMAAALRSRAEHAHPRSDCPRPERIWDAVRLRVRLDERLEIIDHLSECPACAEAWSVATDLAGADEQTVPVHVDAAQLPELAMPASSLPLSTMYGRNALLIGVPALLVLVALGIAFIVFRPAAHPIEDVADVLRPREPLPTTTLGALKMIDKSQRFRRGNSGSAGHLAWPVRNTT